jgi:hypothetical protein
MGMDKGLRVGVNGKFNEMLPKLAELGGKTFRRTILDWTVEQYGCTMAAASTHYAFAKNAADKAVPEMTKGLGRAPEKNNGGRKKKVVDAAVVIWTGVKENTCDDQPSGCGRCGRSCADGVHCEEEVGRQCCCRRPQLRSCNCTGGQGCCCKEGKAVLDLSSTG